MRALRKESGSQVSENPSDVSQDAEGVTRRSAHARVGERLPLERAARRGEFRLVRVRAVQPVRRQVLEHHAADVDAVAGERRPRSIFDRGRLEEADRVPVASVSADGTIFVASFVETDMAVPAGITFLPLAASIRESSTPAQSICRPEFDRIELLSTTKPGVEMLAVVRPMARSALRCGEDSASEKREGRRQEVRIRKSNSIR